MIPRIVNMGLGVLLCCGCAGTATRSGPQAPSLRALAEMHGLRLGTCVRSTVLAESATYCEILAREFNSVTTENELKFPVLRPSRDHFAFERADRIVEFAERHGQAVRGHALVWHFNYPAWLEHGAFTDAEVEAILEDHIRTVVGRYRGRVASWDVVNEAVGGKNGEPYRDTLWLRRLGPSYIEKAFRWAHEADPDALLFYNDYGAEALSSKSDKVHDLVVDLLARGVPIHGVGLQSHFTLDSKNVLDGMAANIGRLQALGLVVEITELDIRLPLPPTPAQLEQQAELYAQVVRMCLENGVQGLTMWGFSDAHSWIPRFYKGEGAALIFDEHYATKPAYHALRYALRAGPK